MILIAVDAAAADLAAVENATKEIIEKSPMRGFFNSSNKKIGPMTIETIFCLPRAKSSGFAKFNLAPQLWGRFLVDKSPQLS